MPKPKGKGRPRPKPKAKGAKPAGRKAKPVAAKKKGVAPAKRARPARKPKAAVPRPEARAPKPTPPVTTKEGGMAKKDLTPDQFLAEILTPEYSRETGHLCWDCKHFKPVQKGSKFPPADTIGWCTQIHWPFFWSITDFNVVKKCYAMEKGIYAPFQPARFP
jgi:hypothetical protein